MNENENKITSAINTEDIKTDEFTTESIDETDLKTEDTLNEEIGDVINSPETTVENSEEKELTEEEKRELFIKQLKESRIRFKNTVHKGNVTITKFGADYHKKRQRKNKASKASRKLARKK